MGKRTLRQKQECRQSCGGRKTDRMDKSIGLLLNDAVHDTKSFILSVRFGLMEW